MLSRDRTAREGWRGRRTLYSAVPASAPAWSLPPYPLRRCYGRRRAPIAAKVDAASASLSSHRCHAAALPSGPPPLCPSLLVRKRSALVTDLYHQRTASPVRAPELDSTIARIIFSRNFGDVGSKQRTDSKPSWRHMRSPHHLCPIRTHKLYLCLSTSFYTTYWCVMRTAKGFIIDQSHCDVNRTLVY